MTINDLKLVSANVQVNNENQINAKYNISATFRTKNNELKGIDSGMVKLIEQDSYVASFSKNIEFEDSLHITYMNDVANDVAAQCEINQFINEFVTLATVEAIREIVE